MKITTSSGVGMEGEGLVKVRCLEAGGIEERRAGLKEDTVGTHPLAELAWPIPVRMES